MNVKIRISIHTHAVDLSCNDVIDKSRFEPRTVSRPYVALISFPGANLKIRYTKSLVLWRLIDYVLGLPILGIKTEQKKVALLHMRIFYSGLNNEARYWLGVMPVSFLNTLVK